MTGSRPWGATIRLASSAAKSSVLLIMPTMSLNGWHGSGSVHDRHVPR
ncbi:hypothetical protein CRENPOLYSF1_740007 [Crenothrix polyspora]|uniref:Uncharacterized protein n=1 Tax=Crenothrix polyspora TaxID=360316 RepID=A0A1R4HHA7_9GAMM|nr:hypothetical protein CRENPOLYSF1_740007 [Crenothrix polyspora]